MKLIKINSNGDVVTLIDRDELVCKGGLDFDEIGNIYISCGSATAKFDPNGNLQNDKKSKLCIP